MSSSGTQLMVGVGDTAEYLSGLLSKVQGEKGMFGQLGIRYVGKLWGESGMRFYHHPPPHSLVTKLS